MNSNNKSKSIILISSLMMMSLVTHASSLTEQLKSKREASVKKTPPKVKAIMNKGVSDLRELGVHKKAIGVGKKVPDVAFKDLDNSEVMLNSLYKDKITILTFYRGGWCPYCMLELDAYQRNLARFKKLGAQVVAVSPDRVQEAKKTVKKRGLTFQVFTDPNNSAAKKFGLAFTVDPGTLGVYKKFGIDLKKSQGNDNNELPLPGTYIVDKAGIIRFSFVDPDYTKRADPEQVLTVLKGL